MIFQSQRWHQPTDPNTKIFNYKWHKSQFFWGWNELILENISWNTTDHGSVTSIYLWGRFRGKDGRRNFMWPRSHNTTEARKQQQLRHSRFIEIDNNKTRLTVCNLRDSLLTFEYPVEYTARVVNSLQSPPLNHVSHSCRSYGPIFTPALQTATASWLAAER